jgi:type I restriction enzyme S subunit
MKKYNSYKPSGENYIGDIPQNWECIRLGMLGVFSSSGIDKKTNENETSVRMVNYTDIIQSRKYNPIQSGEKDYMVVSTPKSKLDEHRLIKGDMVFIPSSETKEDLGYSSLIDFDENDIVYSYHILRYRTHKNIYHYFKKYLINHHSVLNQFSRESKGTTRQIIGRNVFNNVRVVLPPLQEQEQIVNYLDEKTSIIDKLISTKQRKVELLKEQRTTLINQVITKGLNPKVKMKDSGVEWVGEIPENWEVGKLKKYSELRISSVDKHIYENEIQVTVCNYTDVYYNEFITNEMDLRKGSCSEDEFNKFKLNKGDVIITKDSESPTDIGVPSLVNDDFDNVVCGYHLSIIKPSKNKLIGGFLFRQLQTKRIRSYYEICSNGITRFGLGKSSVLETPLIIPPIQEQEQIVQYLDKQTKEIDDLVSMEQNKIELLKEYRQSLISEVITGKIKVVK